MAATLGLDVVTYLADSVTTPVYDNPVGVVKDETVNLTKGLADVTDRRGEGWRIQVSTLKEGSITMQLIYDPTDADFTEFQTAFLNNTQIILFFSDGDATTSGTWQGLLAAFEVSEFSQPRPLEDAVVVDVTLVTNLDPADNAAPKWHSVVVA